MDIAKYTYQDWANGKIEPFNLISLFLKKEISEEDFGKIATQQHKAFLYYLDIAFDALKRNFLEEYNESLLKEEFLDYNISGYKHILDTIRSEHEEIITSALNTGYDGRFELTKSEVDTYLSATVDSKQMEIFVFHFTTDLDDAGIEFEKEQKAPFRYILRSNFYKWLVWFKGQQESKNSEPGLKINSESMPKIVEELMSSHVNYTWKDLFIDKEQADIILNTISEYISDTGQWLEEPKGRTLQALCSELKKKGYLKLVLSANQIANAFNTEFGTDLTSRNFQPGELAKGDIYRDKFHHIPIFKIKSKL
ncbi:hypothetical protein [Pontibacter beigongshangensis]|uniref:hypothetical protein n=1 Tax=Pontibacter beigongshangensis TaxID=2574733 RepID=UPI00164F8B52|nr:hypothetical protein [Pontibacter beigongshangensis]